MKTNKVICIVLVASAALVGCKKSDEEIKKEQEEAFLRQHAIEQIQSDEAAHKAYVESINKPGVLSHFVVTKESAAKAKQPLNQMPEQQIDAQKANQGK